MISCEPDEEAVDELIDSIIKKAEALKENTYSIQKKGGEAQVFNFPPEYSNWYVGTSYMDGTKQAIHLELMDEDEEQMTMSWSLWRLQTNSQPLTMISAVSIRGHMLNSVL
ncbi:MAG: hypothetical protein ACSW76_10010 [Bacteroidaceae bacterium]